MKKIAIQGGYGAFHEIAAHQYFKDEEIEILPRNTFRDMVSTLKSQKSDFGIMAIENSLAGSILPNYSLIIDTGMHIVGEIYLRIKQNLVALKGVKLEDIKEVYSHPMAILQCQQFFDEHPQIRLIESIDTAISAMEISEKKLKDAGAISSQLAATKYGLDIVAESIETNKINYTRFLILSENGCKIPVEKISKASIHFSLAHKIGSLSKILSILSYYEINLAKIQSMPIIGRDWEYKFYVDVEINDYDMYIKSLEAIRPFTADLGILGEYSKGVSVFE
ncbi:MAG: prephenate dehydratase [Bacteroidales bacterium]|nr:prephenate dehydratase [Bacteroidales bacterium]MBN2697280.1 prephenate dehydratase [Bacteroidales bacterium]